MSENPPPPKQERKDPVVTVPESAILNLLQCPVCLDPSITPPIFQCFEGHLVCAQCQPKLDAKCPICRGLLGNARSYLAEQLVSLVFSPCRYSNKGCPSHFLKDQEKLQSEHELDCDHQERQYPCPLTGGSCAWTGDLKAVLPHLQSHHVTLFKYPENQKIQICSDQNPCSFVTLSSLSEKCKVPPTVVLQTTLRHHFVHMVAQTEKELYFATQLVGTKKQAEGFKLRLKLKMGEKKWKLEGVVKSILGGLPETKDCLRIETEPEQTKAPSENVLNAFLNFDVKVVKK